MPRTLYWRGLVETPESYAVVGLNLTEPFDPTSAQIFHKPDPSPAMDAASRSPAFQQFLGFSQFPLWRVTPCGGAREQQAGGRPWICAPAHRRLQASWQARWWIRAFASCGHGLNWRHPAPVILPASLRAFTDSSSARSRPEWNYAVQSLIRRH